MLTPFQIFEPWCLSFVELYMRAQSARDHYNIDLYRRRTDKTPIVSRAHFISDEILKPLSVKTSIVSLMTQYRNELKVVPEDLVFASAIAFAVLQAKFEIDLDHRDFLHSYRKFMRGQNLLESARKKRGLRPLKQPHHNQSTNPHPVNEAFGWYVLDWTLNRPA